MSSQIQLKLLQQQYAELQKLRQQSTTFYDQMEKGIRKDRRELEQTMKKVDAAAFLGTITLGLAKVVGGAAKAVQATGAKLAQLNQQLARDAVKNSANNFRSATALGYKPDNALMEAALNFDSPTWWAQIITGKTPETIFEPLILKVQMARRESQMQLDRLLKEVQSRIRFVQQGGDLSKMA